MSHARRTISILLALIIAASSLDAQITIEIKQGNTWSDHASMPTLTDLSLRWTHEGPVVNPVSWQLTYANPPAPFSTVAKSESIGIAPSSGGYSTFTIPASMIPSNVPSTFHVRVRYLNGSSNWVRVFVGQRASSPTADPHSVLAAASEPRRPEPTTNQGSPLAGLGPITVPPAAAGPAMTAGVANLNNTKLWMSLVGIVCETSTDDGNPDDEIYAITFAVNMNRSNMAASDIYWRLTKVYEGFNDGEKRAVNYPVWASEDEPRQIIDPDNFFVLAAVYEEDDNRPREMAAKVATSLIKAKLAKAPANISRAEFIASIEYELEQTLDGILGWTSNKIPTAAAPTSGMMEGDDRVAHVQSLFLTDIEIDGARKGKPVKKLMAFNELTAKYRLRFEMGKEGTSTVVW